MQKKIFVLGKFDFFKKKRRRRRKKKRNTPGTAGGPGGRDRTLAMKNRKSYAKILGDKLFCTWEIPRSG